MRNAGIVLGGGFLVVSMALLVGFEVLDLSTTLLVLVLLAVVLPICHALPSNVDPWLWWVAPLAFVTKLFGSGARYFVLFGIYGGGGDAIGYHRWGVRLAEVWRMGMVPSLDGSMGEGTQVTRWITGLLYAPYTPSMLGGFFIFATLAFVGQVLFYTSFRRAVPGARLGVYAAFIFFLPALVFWPSSVGKDSLMLLFLGFATYAMARASASYSPSWLGLSVVGLFGAAMIRPHMAALLAVSFVGATLLGRGASEKSISWRRLAVVALGLVLALASIGRFAERFNLDSTDDVDAFVGGLEERTQEDGSAVEGERIQSPSQLPAGALRALFRPLPYEAHNRQAMANALESSALLLLLIWRTPAMIKHLRTLRMPHVLMSFIFTSGFVLAFSSILNLGILARQRSQVLPYLLAVVVALGWRTRESLDPDRGRHLAVTQ